MRVTVCELRNRPEELAEDWRLLQEHAARERSELVLLPEMPFSAWLAGSARVDPELWKAAVEEHEAWIGRLEELGAPAVLSTRPVLDSGAAHNEGFSWRADGRTIRGVHRKYYLPEEEGFWEASWYRRGDGSFGLTDLNGVRAGFLICTEMWFTRHAREYCLGGIDLLACPRATLAPSTDKWLAGGRAAAVVSGAFCLSSNFSGSAEGGQSWGGTGWIIEPEEGEVLGTTRADEPFLTLEIDLEVARTAKSTYPRYVDD
ncbi:MAG: carbon-nitrogen hydrolase family protein [Acidobacteriota bacterium]